MAMITTSEIGCAHIRRELLQRRVGPQSLDQRTERINTHLQQCLDCRTFAAEQQDWLRLGRQLQQTEGAPAATRQRLFNTLALERSHLSTSRHSIRTIGIAVLIALAPIAAGGYWLAASLHYKESARTTASAVVQDHWREIHGQSISSTDKAATEHWLRQRLSLPVEVVEFDNGSLTGARLCFLNQEVGAVIHYEVNNQPLSYYIMPSSKVHAEDREAIRREAKHGYNVLFWRDKELFHALVSTLPETYLEQLAQTCRQMASQDSQEKQHTG